MNKVTLFGRLVRDVDVRYTENGKIIANFTVAVDRPKAKGQEKADADFISCKAFNKTGEIIGNYFSKGSRILLEGTIRTGSYKNKNGDTVYTTDVFVNDFAFVDKRSSNNNGGGNGGYSNNSYSSNNTVPPDFDVPF